MEQNFPIIMTHGEYDTLLERMDSMCSYNNDLVKHAFKLYNSSFKRKKQVEPMEKDIAQLKEEESAN